MSLERVKPVVSLGHILTSYEYVFSSPFLPLHRLSFAFPDSVDIVVGEIFVGKLFVEPKTDKTLAGRLSGIPFEAESRDDREAT